MKKIFMAAVVAATVPQIASAQSTPSPVIIVVDGNKAGTECNACKTALQQLQTQAQGLQTYRQQLEAPLQTEGQQIQQQADALNGKQPDAALTAKYNAFQQKQANANQQLQTRAATFERNRNYVLKQISDRMGPAIDAVQARRKANLVLEAGTVARFAPALDATAEVIAELNRTLTSIPTVAPAAPAQQNPQGR